MDPKDPKDLNAVINSKGYVVKKASLPSELQDEIRKELTVKPLTNPNQIGGGNSDVEPYPVYMESKHNLYLPRFYGIEKLGPPARGIVFPDVESRPRLNTTMTLRDYQTPIIDQTLSLFRDEKTGGGGLLELYTGSGKTSIAIYLMCELKVKTLIIVHKSFLLQQWVERITQFVPGASIGVIQGPKADVADKDVVIGMLQTLSMKDPKDLNAKTPENKDVFSGFGFVCCDESHHMGAEVFCRALMKISCRYMLGLSATPHRKDGLTKVIHWFLGPTAYALQRDGSRSQQVVVKKIVVKSTDKSYTREARNFRGMVMLPEMINNITEYAPRNALIIHEVLQYVREPGRQVMVISDRINHLHALKDMIDSTGYTGTVGFYTGQQKQKELRVSETASIIFSSYAMCREGLDIQSLNTLVLATSTGDVVQTCGRILRKTHDVSPLIVDITDVFSTFAGQSKKRDAFYKKSKYLVCPYTHSICIGTGPTSMSNLNVSSSDLEKGQIKSNKKEKEKKELDKEKEPTYNFVEDDD